MKAIIYSRVSTTEQKEQGFSLQDQETRLRKFCFDKGYDVVEHYQDDYSAKDFQRPAFKKMITDLVQKNIKAQKLVCVEVDRFSRNTGEAIEMIGVLKKFGIEVEFSDGGMDTRTPEGKFLRNIKLSMAELDNDLKGKRTRAGLRQAQREGRWVNSPPRGYSRGLGELKGILQPNDKAKWVIKAFEEVSKGQDSIEAIRLKLAREGFKVPKASFHHMLQNPVYIGNIFIQAIPGEPEETVKGLHKPIITERLFYKTQEAIKGKRKVNIRQGNLDPNLPLRGHLICPLCGKKLTGSASINRAKEKYYYYHCQNHCKARFNAKKANERFLEYLKTFDIPKDVAMLYQKIVEDVFKNKARDKEDALKRFNAELKELRVKEHSADDKFISDLIDNNTYQRIKKQCQERSSEINTRIQDLQMSMQDFQNWLKSAFRIIPDIAKRFEKSGISIQHKILCSIFPENLVFDGTEYRTQGLNEVFALICNNDKGFEGGQKKRTGKITSPSNLAPLLGLEPRTL